MNEITCDFFYRENQIKKSYFKVENKQAFKIEIWKNPPSHHPAGSTANVAYLQFTCMIHKRDVSTFNRNFPYRIELVPCEANSKWNESFKLTCVFNNDKNSNELQNCINRFINNFLTKKEKPIFTSLIESFINPVPLWNVLKNENFISEPQIKKFIAKLLKETPSLMVNKIIQKIISDEYVFFDHEDSMGTDEIIKIEQELQDNLKKDFEKANLSDELFDEALALLYPYKVQKEGDLMAETSQPQPEVRQLTLES